MTKPEMKRAIVATAVTASLLGALIGLSKWAWNRGLPEGLIHANGRIEGDHITIASKFPGRIVELAVREGRTVEKGDLLIRLDDAQVRAKVDQAARLVDGLVAQVEAAHTSLAVLNLDVPIAIEAASAKVESVWNISPSASFVIVITHYLGEWIHDRLS